MGSPMVTIGLPFYNNESTLLDAVRSIFAQTVQDWELVLLDDGSTDNSLEVARSIDDPRVRVISDGNNLKLAARLNQIHREARGVYVARMDADDMMHPQRLEKEIAVLTEHPEVDVVGSLMYMMSAPYEVYGVGAGGIAGREFHPSELLGKVALMHPTIMGRPQWFLDNPYDETWARAQDSELWCRTCRHSKFTQINEALYLYPVHADETNPDLVGGFLRRMVFRRRLLRDYGPQLVGWPGTIVRYARTYVHAGLYRAFGLFHIEDRLVRHNSRPLSLEEQADVAAAIERIRNTPVPLKGAGAVASA
ncbi:MAG: glycosyltransferase family A protein [Armatimonadia bacterium]